MKNVYTCPIMEIVKLDNKEVFICTSPIIEGGSSGEPGTHGEAKSILFDSTFGESNDDDDEL